VRNLGFRLFSAWYLRPLLEQQNEVNRELAARLETAQETAAALDREITDLRRQQARAIYRLEEQRRRVEAQVDALRAEVEGRSSGREAG
jgi:small-conductance mechanosensitive channel